MNAPRPFVTAACLLALAAPASAQQLTERTYERLRDYVLPDADEEAWRQVGWLPSLWEAVVAAHETKQPILLWAMNGHPLGQT